MLVVVRIVIPFCGRRVMTGKGAQAAFWAGGYVFYHELGDGHM